MSPFWELRILMRFWIFAKKNTRWSLTQSAQDDCCAMNGNRSGRKQSCPNWRCGPIPTCVRALAALGGGGDKGKVVLPGGGGGGGSVQCPSFCTIKTPLDAHRYN